MVSVYLPAKEETGTDADSDPYCQALDALESALRSRRSHPAPVGQLIIAGDFNAKLHGRQQGEEEIMGERIRSRRRSSRSNMLDRTPPES